MIETYLIEYLGWGIYGFISTLFSILIGSLVARSDNHIGTVTSSRNRDNLLLAGSRIRLLTPVECERLQGFPDNWTVGVSDTQRYKQLGNAVTVNVVYEILKRL